MAVYLREFTFLSDSEEADFILSYPYQLEMRCYGDSVYPFKLLPNRGIQQLEFEAVTLLCGENGSGKSTCLNIIAEKLKLDRGAPFNHTPLFEAYIRGCRFELTESSITKGRVITSDDVFERLLGARAVNEAVARERDELFSEYDEANSKGYRLGSLRDIDELKRRNDARRMTKSAYTTTRMSRLDVAADSNGECALDFFTNAIGDGKLYLLDEPENSLSPRNQLKLASFIADSARFFGCQFIISTHSPFFLALRGAKIYDLDHGCRVASAWTELDGMKAYIDFFNEYADDILK